MVVGTVLNPLCGGGFTNLYVLTFVELYNKRKESILPYDNKKICKMSHFILFYGSIHSFLSLPMIIFVQIVLHQSLGKYRCKLHFHFLGLKMTLKGPNWIFFALTFFKPSCVLQVTDANAETHCLR